MGSLNARSVVRKGPLIQELISSHRLDALAISESWICGDDPDAIKLDSVPDGFRVMHVPRPTATHRNRGGGLCFIHRDELTVKRHPIQRSMQHQTFECQLLSILNAAKDRPADKPLVLANIYRPPSATIPSVFYDELSDLLTKVGDFIDTDRFILCGDFNCLGPNSTVDTELMSLFDYHGLCQHVSTPTHHTSTTNNVLELLVGSSDSDRIASVEVLPAMMSQIMSSSRGRSPDNRCRHVIPSRTASGTSSPSTYRGSRMISRTRVCSPIQRKLPMISRFKSTRS